jgi:tetratricopeptide (TPR) repeat protein
MSMTQIETDPYPNQEGKCLYQKTDLKLEQDNGAPLLPGQDESASIVLTKIKSLLTNVFPDMLSGENFLEYASNQLESWDHFEAMVMCPDRSEDDGSGNCLNIPEFMAILAETVDEICKLHYSFWGICYTNCLVCFVEGKNKATDSGIAEQIRKKLKIRTEASFSMGIAVYPQLSYKKNDIIENAYKALLHAGFLGPSSIVRFDAVSLNISGDKLYQEGDVDNAIAEFEKALLIDPLNINVSNSLGVCYSSKGEHEKALDEFTKVMTLVPDDVMAAYNAGLTYHMVGNKPKAMEMFLKAHALDENQFEVVIQLGRLYLEIKDLEMGRKYLEKAAEMDVESGPAHRFLGECYNELNMVNEAVLAYSKAVKLNANDAYSLSALACLYARQKINQEIAVVFARQSVDLSPSTALFHYRLGRVYYLHDRFEEALKEFKTASALGHDCRSFIFETENRLLADAS